MIERTTSELPFPLSTAEKPGVSLRGFGRGRLGHQIGVVEMAKVSNTTIADIREANPHASVVMLYQLFADQLPHFISSKSQLEALQATKSADSQISKAGTQTFILLNMKSILFAAAPYLTGNPDHDDDLIQAGIANLLTGIPRITLNHSYGPSQYVHIDVLVRTGIVQERANQESLPVSWVRYNLDTKKGANKLIDASFIDHPYGLTKEQVKKAAKEISEQTGIPTVSILPVIRARNFLLSDTEPIDEEYLANAAHCSDLKPRVATALTRFEGVRKENPRRRVVLEARCGLKDGETHTFKEIGELIGLQKNPGTIAQQLAEATLRELRNSRYDLAPLLFPNRGIRLPKPPQGIIINRQALPITTQEIAPVVCLVPSNLVSETRLRYRYPRIGLGYSTNKYGMLGILGLSDNVTTALHRINIKNLTQLLTTEESTLTKAGITTVQIEHIKSRIIRFLQRDSKVITIGQQTPDKVGTGN